MKTKKDPRHLKRVLLMQSLFAYEFNEDLEVDDQVKEIVKSLKKIDSLIEKAAPNWPIKNINRIDLAILRLSVYELIIVKEVPPKVVVDEAVELAKEYGSESSFSFINGALGKLIENENIAI